MVLTLTEDVACSTGCIFPEGFEFEFDLNKNLSSVVFTDRNSYFPIWMDNAPDIVFIPMRLVRFSKTSNFEETAFINSYINKNLKKTMLFCEVNASLESFPMFYSREDALNLSSFYKSKETVVRHILYDIMLESAIESGCETFIVRKAEKSIDIEVVDAHGNPAWENVNSIAAALVFLMAKEG